MAVAEAEATGEATEAGVEAVGIAISLITTIETGTTAEEDKEIGSEEIRQRKIPRLR